MGHYYYINALGDDLCYSAGRKERIRQITSLLSMCGLLRKKAVND